MPVLSKCGAVYLIPHELEAKLAQVETPQGVYAMVKKLDKTLSWDRIEYTGKSILLVDLQDAGNEMCIRDRNEERLRFGAFERSLRSIRRAGYRVGRLWKA